MSNNFLVAYFSHSGNTRVVAQQIHEKVGGDIFEIISVNLYPRDYNECVNQAKKELRENYKPILKTKIDDMKPYDMVFLGYPNWWGTIPMPVVTFLSEHDLSNKTIAPFCTNEGSQLGRSVEDIKKLCPKSTVVRGLSLRGSGVKNAQNDVSKWLRELDTNK